MILYYAVSRAVALSIDEHSDDVSDHAIGRRFDWRQFSDMGTLLRAHKMWQSQMLGALDSESRFLVFIPDENGIGNRFMALVRPLLSTRPLVALYTSCQLQYSG